MFTGDQSDLHAGEANSPLAPLARRQLGAGPRRARAPAPAHAAAAALPGFARSRRFREVIREVAEAEVARWQPGRSSSRLRERMRALTFEVICRAVFGVTEPARVDRLRAAFAPRDRHPAGASSSPLPLRPRPRPPEPAWRSSPRLRRRRRPALRGDHPPPRPSRTSSERTDVLSLLLRARDEDGGADVRLRAPRRADPRCSRPDTRPPQPASRSRSISCSAIREALAATAGRPPGGRRRIPRGRRHRVASPAARDRRRRAHAEGATGIAGWELPPGSGLSGDRPRPSPRRPLPRARRFPPSASLKGPPSPTPGFPSAGRAASARRSPRPRWRR